MHNALMRPSRIESGMTLMKVRVSSVTNDYVKVRIHDYILSEHTIEFETVQTILHPHPRYPYP